MHNGTLSKTMDFAFKLPVDEDDYLMPSPGPVCPTGYVDLIGDTKTAGKLLNEIFFFFNFLINNLFFPIDMFNNKSGRYIPDFVPLGSQSRCGVDNLEYHLMQREHEYYNALPNRSMSSGVPHHNGQMILSQNPNNGPQVIHIVGNRKIDDIEEMSDEHDYYNEFDRLQRELQPLNHRRSETTV